MDHLGIEVEQTEQVTAATQRLEDTGLATFEENDASCCYTLQDKVWVHGPGQEPWTSHPTRASTRDPARPGNREVLFAPRT